MAHPKETQKYTHKLSAHLREDERVREVPIGKLKVYTSPMYDIDFYVYPRLPAKPAFSNAEVVCALVTYKEEALRILVKIETADAQKDPDGVIRSCLKKMEHQNQSPLLLVRRAKTWCNVPLTKADLITLAEAGIDVQSVN